MPDSSKEDTIFEITCTHNEAYAQANIEALMPLTKILFFWRKGAPRLRWVVPLILIGVIYTFISSLGTGDWFYAAPSLLAPIAIISLVWTERREKRRFLESLHSLYPEGQISYYFGESGFISDDKVQPFTYSQTGKIEDIGDYFVLHFGPSSRLLLDKAGFNKGNPADFSAFIQRKIREAPHLA